MWLRPEDLLSIRLHVSLLKVGGEAVHVLVVREQGVRLGAEEVAVPLQSNHDHVFQYVADTEFKISTGHTCALRTVKVGVQRNTGLCLAPHSGLWASPPSPTMPRETSIRG